MRTTKQIIDIVEASRLAFVASPISLEETYLLVKRMEELERLIDRAAWLFSSSEDVRDEGLLQIVNADEPAFIALITSARDRETNQVLKLNMEQGLKQLKETVKEFLEEADD